MNMRPIGIAVVVALSVGCGRGRIAGEGSTGESSTSGPASTSDATESGTDDGPEPEPDACPAEPELVDYASRFDDVEHAFEFFGGLDGETEWTQACTVVAHTGTLASGEDLELDCIDGEGMEVSHTIHLLAEVEGAPEQAPLAEGQQVLLSVWAMVWHGGTLAWTVRDLDQGLLIAHYDSPFLPGDFADFAPSAEFLAPLVIDVDEEVCPLVCEPDGPGGVVPGGGCCDKETATVLDLGAGAVEILNRSAGDVPGGGWAVVLTSTYFELDNCVAGDIDEYSYHFTLIAT